MIMNEDFTNDLEMVNERRRDYKDYRIIATDPYGFWHIERKGKGGPIADVLKGNFTSIDKAKIVIDRYINSQIKPEPTIISTDGKGGKRRVTMSQLAKEAEEKAQD